MFSVRRMSPADKPAIMEISSRIWEGSDYLPAVFDEWVEDREGEFVAVLLGGHVVGCCKLTFFSPAHAWLEGLRKDPRISAKGAGVVAARHLLAALARRPGLQSVRFATYVNNRVSIAINERLGFQKRTVLSLKAWEGVRAELDAAAKQAEARLGLPGSPKIETVRDPRLIADYLAGSGYFCATDDLVVEGWRALPYSPALIDERFGRTGLCRGVRSAAGLAGLCISKPVPMLSRMMVRLVCLDAEEDGVAHALLDDVFIGARGAMARTDTERCEVEWMLPRGERFPRWCAAQELKSWEQVEDFLIYEMPLATLVRFAASGAGGVQ
jgi:RimJ/RimL family protein N-acetyltransferase